MEYKRELLFKILVLGDFGVGKTSIVKRYAEDTFSPSYKITIGADFALRTIEWNKDTRINLQLWDIAGHERFGSLTSVYYRYALAAAVVFDLTRPATFDSIDKWVTDLRDRITLPNGSDIPIILLANKGDITTSNIETEKLNAFCTKHKILTWLITSAKENINLDEAMNKLMKVTIENVDQTHTQSPKEQIILTSDSKPQKRLCFI
ncbi:ras-related protein Rab-32B-like [Atheta coriaria]|uniref:ras-related protein Rab-32B-like n=1 Tax=Dalotia coriaria TaxID=877792 RepID=UPI0031F40228